MGLKQETNELLLELENEISSHRREVIITHSWKKGVSRIRTVLVTENCFQFPVSRREKIVTF